MANENLRPRQLVLASTRAPHLSQVTSALRPDTMLINYSYEDDALPDILNLANKGLGNVKVESVAFLTHSSEMEIFISSPDSKVLTAQSAKSDEAIRDFMKNLVNTFVDRNYPQPRLDFLCCYAALHFHGLRVAHELDTLLNIPVGICKDLLGLEAQVGLHPLPACSLGEVYFNVVVLEEKLKESMEGSPKHIKNMDAYEKIRTVGKGAFGTAVLYRRKDDDFLIIVKEINMHDLTAAERQLALNEAQMLSLMDHPNIISYYDSFEHDGTLMIQMEYADGGTLSQYLRKQNNHLSEMEILGIFRQIVMGIRYMHEQNVLHRDLKTANIFLKKDGSVKVGDLGIAKMLTTRHGNAQTVLGTPYYISPEMCEGKTYDKKSDIWALGCIIYEMACLQRTFEGSNLPALVNKIMKGQFQPIPGDYSPGFRHMIHDLLQRDPDFRPSVEELLEVRLPSLMGSQYDVNREYKSLSANISAKTFSKSFTSESQNSTDRSVVYHMTAYESGISLAPVPLPPRSRIKELSVSNSHMIALTAEWLVFTWGEDRKGQLGHGQLEPWRSHPECVEALKGKAITRVGAGEGFSVFASDTGMMMTCGDGTFGCLGHGDWNSTSRPKLIETLLSVDVALVSCGPQHVLIASGEGVVYSWGRGDGGRLGLGHENDCCLPQEVILPEDVRIRKIACGGDGTILVAEDGVMYACGNNAANKLGLEEKKGIMAFARLVPLKSRDEKVLKPRKIRSVPCPVVEVTMGPTFTAVLTNEGNVVTFGNNSEGQLGRGNSYYSPSPAPVKIMDNKGVSMIQCGPTFMMAGTADNALYMWGTTYINPDTPSELSDLTTTGSSLIPGSSVPSLPHDFEKQRDSDFSGSNRSNSRLLSSYKQDIRLRQIVTDPQEILALYSSPSQVHLGETVNLVSLHSQHQNVYIMVDTTAPLAKLPANLRPLESGTQDTLISTTVTQKNSQATSLAPHVEISEDEYEATVGPVPQWVQAELDSSDAAWKEEKWKEPSSHPFGMSEESTEHEHVPAINSGITK